MSINPSDPRPAYQQIAGHLRGAIAEGRFPAGEWLPPERQLARQYGVTPVTARRALGVLASEGLIDVHPGRGALVRQPRPIVAVSSAYVTERPGQPLATWRTEIEAQGLTSDQRLTMVGRVQAPTDIAARLQLPEADEWPAVIVRRRVMLVEGEPYQLADSYFPVDVAEGSRLEDPRKIKGGTIAALAALGFTLERHAEAISSRMPTPEQRAALSLGAGVPIIRIVRTSYAAAGRPVEVTDMTLAADRHTITYDLPARAPGSEPPPAIYMPRPEPPAP